MDVGMIVLRFIHIVTDVFRAGGCFLMLSQVGPAGDGAGRARQRGPVGHRGNRHGHRALRLRAMNDQLFTIPFLGIFCVAGGLGLGHGLRALIHDRSPRGAFFIVWGAIFGGVPCTIGTSTFLAAHSGPLFLVSPILFLSAMVLSLTILPELLEDIGGGT